MQTTIENTTENQRRIFMESYSDLLTVNSRSLFSNGSNSIQNQESNSNTNEKKRKIIEIEGGEEENYPRKKKFYELIDILCNSSDVFTFR